MTPARRSLYQKRNPQRARICELLIALGLPKKEVHPPAWRNGTRRRTGSFWHRNEGALDLWLERAHAAYRCRMINLHPDHGGSTADAILCNAIWKQVKHLFEKHGVKL